MGRFSLIFVIFLLVFSVQAAEWSSYLSKVYKSDNDSGADPGVVGGVKSKISSYFSRDPEPPPEPETYPQQSRLTGVKNKVSSYFSSGDPQPEQQPEESRFSGVKNKVSSYFSSGDPQPEQQPEESRSAGVKNKVSSYFSSGDQQPEESRLAGVKNKVSSYFSSGDPQPEQQPQESHLTGVKNKITSYFSSGNSQQSPGTCDHEPPTPANARLLCSQFSGCRADCRENYEFPNKATQIFYTCKDGKWLIDEGIWQYVPPCQPICLPPCQNNGICIAPGQCTCPENFAGPYCQFTNAPCVSYPALPMNARRACTPTSCTISCMPGNFFPDGSNMITASCKNGLWIPNNEKWKSFPDCQPQCNPPCQNGGICAGVGHCQCPKDLKGPQCQYRSDNCDPRKLAFNGGYNCSGDASSFNCALRCAEGMMFSSPPAAIYSCFYQTGKFTPTPIPQCVFPSQGQVQKPGYSQYYEYMTNGSSYPNVNNVLSNYEKYLPGWGQSQTGSNIPVYNQGSSHGGYIPPNYQQSMVDSQMFHGYENMGFVQKLPEAGTCFTWQGTHYKTFDGKVYSFDSKCAHTLVRDSEDKTFSIIVQNDPVCNIQAITCSKIINIFFDNNEYILKRSKEGIPIFSTLKKRLPIPAQLPGLRVETSGYYITLSLDSLGVKLRWDGQQLVQVEVQESLWNKTEGLCGKIDGNPENDVTSKNGRITTISNFALMWKVEDLQNSCDYLPNEEHSCNDNEVIRSVKGADATSFCRKLLNDQRFVPCHQVMDVTLLLDACRWDYCACTNPDPSICACETMNVYVRACSHKGVTNLANWRDEKTCPMKCTGGRIYKTCGPVGGQPICGSSSTYTGDDKETCVEGCYCPPGTVLHEGRCITPEMCPCKMRSQSYPPGSQVPKDCNTCICTSGKWVCTQVSCGSRCAAIGDPHYVTFDGKRFDFMGQCSYYLVKTGSFSIEGENVACAGAISEAMNLPSSISMGLPSCTKTVTVRVQGQVIKLKQNHDVVVNGLDVTKLPYNLGNITIRTLSSIFLQVELHNGVKILWDGFTRVYIDIPANFPELTKGLCGTYNNNQKDDFVTPEGDIEQAVIPFANKWKTSEKCHDVPYGIKIDPCTTNIQNQPTAEQHCRKIKSSLFQPCHWIVDPEPYYQDCLYDMCSCEFKSSKCLCPTIAAYAEECARHDVKLDWRGSIKECGIHCPNGQKYQICGNSCTRTCDDIATRTDCKPQCVEGCNCPEGETLDEENECVPIGRCKCTYDGLKFNPGYKEVRPATFGADLCTCINAFWSCRSATREEVKQFPKASDIKHRCDAFANMEFTTCESPEAKTCKNMDYYDDSSPSVCHNGCKCKDGFVLDTSTKRCIKPSECPCHHGGKSYKEDSIVQNDCNTCMCKQGKWTCTDSPCASECSAWGDSHFKTFDGRHYDFQGDCDYTLAKGVLGSDSFDISIQNVPCGSLGTSCSKSLTIRVKSSGDQDVITLTRDKVLKPFISKKHVTIRTQGIFVIIEAPSMGLLIQWDKGTRVYVKLDPRWKNKINGLCGNYNDDESDDFQTPFGGNEVSAIIFGDSWKLESYCAETSEVTNTCENRPERKTWALKKCGVLKSSLFAPCHSEVDIDFYYQKCIFDSCACDQGGDCECLCTALAAYSYECNTRGVPIKWRSQKLCPMQCDERCSKYSPCTSTCPIETCDNVLTQNQMSKNCNQATCVEGCLPKPCPLGEIYLNSSFLDCVPRNVCKPICLEIDGVIYYEGDLIESDQCHSCFCSLGTKTCKGQPCLTQAFTTSTPLIREDELIKCHPGWSEWINQDADKTGKIVDKVLNVIGTKKEDNEPLPTWLITSNLTGGKCTIPNMIDIQCRTVDKHLAPNETKSKVECSLERGLKCTYSLFSLKACPDFEIRVLCQCEGQPAFCDLLKPHKEHSEDCHKFYHCQNTIDGPQYVEKSCGPSMFFNPMTLVCDWPYAVEEIKPECKAEVVTETATKSTDEGVVDIRPPTCPPGMRTEECAIRCDRLCLYYSYIVRSSGFCNNNAKCESGCVNPAQKLYCPDGMVWATNDTCVSIADCMCKSSDNKPVKPGTIYRESDCRICQCVDNYYTCDTSACKEEVKPTVPTTVKTKEPLIEIPTTVTPPRICLEDHLIDLIQGDQALDNVTFSATSSLNAQFSPEYARFDSEVNEISGGSWNPAYANTLQHLDIDLGQQEPVYGIKIKGSPIYDEYVTSYRVSYSPDGSDNFVSVMSKEKLPQIFRGSFDSTTPVDEVFEPPFEATIVRIVPQTWHGSIALKVELLGCGEVSTETVPFEFITVSTPASMLCNDPMGVYNGVLPDEQITVSSEIDRDHTKTDIKLSSEKAWQPVTNSPTEFVQFDFLEPRKITKLETKGGPNGWVTTFIVKYSHDGKVWNPLIDKKTKTERIFLGNYDSQTPQINNFYIPVNAQFLKIIPKKWTDNIQMRVEPYGCFEPYPTPSGGRTTTVPSSCNICPDVVSEPMELQACRCENGKWWDGENCVSRTECPCLVGHVSYPVGTSYKKDDCSECLCKIGGVAYCTTKLCDSCEKGLRSTVTSTCQCTCQPCPDGTTLCPTSNVCINSALWCNGVQDCPDDEINCFTKPPLTTTPAPPKRPECPVVECPPGYIKQEQTKDEESYSRISMFSEYGINALKDTYINTDVVPWVKSWIWKEDKPVRKEVEVLNCTEYICASTKPPPKFEHTRKECPPTTCPPGFIPILQPIDWSSNYCPGYYCYQPPPPSVCNVTGRTFNTFDGTEFKYDICNHILARDLFKNEWQISLKKTCQETCWRDLIILHEDKKFVFLPNLAAEYDGFSYTPEQTKRIGASTKSFTITRLGNILLFVSNRYGFWIIWDQEGGVKLGVTRQLANKVDGLCGFFNEYSADDKMKPDGSIARTTIDFGDSWKYPGDTQVCEPRVCPIDVQKKALEICQIKQKALESCTMVVNKNAFISRCVETTCDCLLAAKNKRSAQEDCRCRALEDFVVECLMREPNIDISDWRTKLVCPVTCEAPLVYHDCYQRKCEPTCKTLANSEVVCPKLPNVCFPGCYCPPGTVKKGDTCISPSNCRDCECNVMPHLQYITYDDSNFTLNADCIYVMSRDVAVNNKHKFQVLITNAPCKNNEKKICVGKVTILYENKKIYILNDMIRRKLRMIVNGKTVKDYSQITWGQVIESPNKHIRIQLSDIQVQVDVYYPSLGTGVKSPSNKYGGKLEGLCGDCDTNPYNDFRLPSGKIIKDPEEFALSWLYENPPRGQVKEKCTTKKETCKPLPKESDPCAVLLDHKVFGQCLTILDPSLFLDWCKKDTCGNHPELACSSIEAYTSDCANVGFCVNWRTNICPPKECPSDKIYNPCGPKCPKTCDENVKFCPKIPVEGCFCPEGLVLRNETCVRVDDCIVCDEEGHRPGDTWKKDKCTTCTCEGTSLTCNTERCSESGKICEAGYKLVQIPSKQDECCANYACMQDQTTICETPQPIKCTQDQTMKLSNKPNGCQQFICECKPPESCKPIDRTSQNLDVGFVKTIDTTGCCPEVEIVCRKELCPQPKQCLDIFETLKSENITGKCCPVYTCETPKNKCIYENKYISAETGGERLRTQMEKQRVLKNPNETWDDGPCRQCKCKLTNVNYQPACIETKCSSIELTQDFRDYQLIPEFVYDECCPNFKRTACKYNGKIYKVGESWSNGIDYCTVYQCIITATGIQKETQVNSCETKCPAGYDYIPAPPKSNQCCGSCKPTACVVDDVVYKVGEEWTSKDFCVKFSCLNVDGSMQVQSIKVNCAELTKDYLENYVFESRKVDGECCKEHKTTGCKVGERVYKVGEDWPSPDGDKCKSISCVKNEKDEIVKQETIQTCQTDCKKGTKYEKSNTSCCGSCIRIACVVDDQLRKPKENWTSTDNCTTFTCEQSNGEFIVTSHQESCPLIDDCPKKNIYKKGCCKHCNITSLEQKLCTPQEMPLNKTVELVVIPSEGHSNCYNRKPIESLMECKGSCPSSTVFNKGTSSIECKCTCCQATKYKSIDVEIECDDGETFKEKIEVPSQCACRRCGAQATKSKRNAFFDE